MSQSRRVRTPAAILSYPHLFTPQEPFRNKDGVAQGEPKYGAVLVFAEGTDLSGMQAVAQIAGEEKFGAAAFQKGLKSGKITSPFRDDDDKGYPENAVFINAKSTDQPGIVGRYADPGTGKPVVITEQNDVYPGCIVKASITAYGYDVNGNKGVSFALNNIQKWDDGTRLDGRIAAADEFEAEPLSEADLEDLNPAPTADAESESDEGLNAFM